MKNSENKHGFIYSFYDNSLYFLYYDLVLQKIRVGAAKITRSKEIKRYLGIPLKKISMQIDELKFGKFVPSLKMYKYIIGKRKKRPRDKGNWYLYEMEY